MVKKTDIIADLHTHTVFSRHAYSTLKENCDEAASNGMKYIAVTDHFMQNGSSVDNKNELCAAYYVSNVKPRNGVKIISGAEFNIGQNPSPEIKDNAVFRNIRWRPIGLHSWFILIPQTSILQIPALFEQSLNSFVCPTCFAHIERELTLCRFDNNSDSSKRELVKNTMMRLVDIAVANDIFLEVNETSLRKDDDTPKRVAFWLKYAKKKNAKISLGSDAHWCENVGDFTKALELINEIGFKTTDIVNCNENLLEEMTHRIPKNPQKV